MTWSQMLGVLAAAGGMAMVGYLLGVLRTQRRLALDYANRTLAAVASQETKTHTDIELSTAGMRVVSHHVTSDGQRYDITSRFTLEDVERLATWWQRRKAAKEAPPC